MPRILPLAQEQTPATVKAAYEKHVRDYHGRITNMKATLGYSLTAFDAYMTWYPLFEEIKKILGNRLATLFAWSISEASDCPLCSTYFRKTMIETGENPESLIVTEAEQRIIDFGAAVAQNKGYVKDEIFQNIQAHYSNREIVMLTAFAGIMIATNIFNNVLETNIDDYLHPFKKINT